MCLNLRDYQLKIITNIYRLLYLNLMVTTNQKQNTQTHTKKNPNITLKVLSSRKGREQKKKTTKTTAKQLTKWYISTYLSIITLNVNGVDVPVKRLRVGESIQK